MAKAILAENIDLPGPLKKLSTDERVKAFSRLVDKNMIFCEQLSSSYEISHLQVNSALLNKYQ